MDKRLALQLPESEPAWLEPSVDSVLCCEARDVFEERVGVSSGTGDVVLPRLRLEDVEEGGDHNGSLDRRTGRGGGEITSEDFRLSSTGGPARL